MDSNLNIRNFTEYVGREFQLMDHDVGRPSRFSKNSFPAEDIIKDAGEVLKNLVPIDREVTGMNGRFYTLRIAPYGGQRRTISAASLLQLLTVWEHKNSRRNRKKI